MSNKITHLFKKHTVDTILVLVFLFFAVAAVVHKINASAGGPMATDVTVMGTPSVGGTLTANYQYENTNDKWSYIGNQEFSSSQANFTSLALAPDGTPYIAYQDAANSNQITVMKFNGSNWVNVGTPGFSDSEADYVSLAIDQNGTPYVAYDESTNCGAGLNSAPLPVKVAKKADAAAVEPVAVAAPAPAAPKMPDTSGSYVCGVVVMKFDGQNWIPVGTPGFSGGEASYVSLALFRGTPYVAFSDSTESYGATVMKYIQQGWDEQQIIQPDRFPNSGEYTISCDGVKTASIAYNAKTSDIQAALDSVLGVGNVVVTGDMSSSISLDFTKALGENPQPIAQIDASALLDKSGKAIKPAVSEAKQGSTGWVVVGTPGFTNGEADYTSLAIDSYGTPYVGYSDYAGNSGKVQPPVLKEMAAQAPAASASTGGAMGDSTYGQANVMKFNGSQWVTVGIPDFSNSEADYVSLAIDQDGTPYVAYDEATDCRGQMPVVNPEQPAEPVKKAEAAQSAQAEAAMEAAAAPAAATAEPVAVAAPAPVATAAPKDPECGLVVMGFDGKNWDMVGTPGFSGGEADYVSLSIDPSGTPYVAYEDTTNSDAVTVMKYVAKTNEQPAIGMNVTPTSGMYTVSCEGANSTTYDATSPSIQSALYSIFAGDNLNLTQFGLIGWVPVGMPGFSGGQAQYTSLAIDSYGTPYVGYSDYAGNSGGTGVAKQMAATAPGAKLPAAMGGQASVMKYNSDAEGNSIYKWYRDGVAIPGANGMSYTCTGNDIGHTITFGVTPVSQKRVQGNEAQSNSFTITTAK